MSSRRSTIIDHAMDASTINIIMIVLGVLMLFAGARLDFLLAPGELLAAFSPRLQVVAYEHGLELLPKPAVRQRICAVNGATCSVLSAV